MAFATGNILVVNIVEYVAKVTVQIVALAIYLGGMPTTYNIQQQISMSTTPCYMAKRRVCIGTFKLLFFILFKKTSTIVRFCFILTHEMLDHLAITQHFFHVVRSEISIMRLS